MVVEGLKYSEKDVRTLNDSTKELYYKDAAYIEFENVIKDSVTRGTEVRLNENAISEYYQDLLFIYNNSF